MIIIAPPNVFSLKWICDALNYGADSHISDFPRYLEIYRAGQVPLGQHPSPVKQNRSQKRRRKNPISESSSKRSRPSTASEGCDRQTILHLSQFDALAAAAQPILAGNQLQDSVAQSSSVTRRDSSSRDPRSQHSDYPMLPMLDQLSHPAASTSILGMASYGDGPAHLTRRQSYESDSGTIHNRGTLSDQYFVMRPSSQTNQANAPRLQNSAALHDQYVQRVPLEITDAGTPQIQQFRRDTTRSQDREQIPTMAQVSPTVNIPLLKPATGTVGQENRQAGMGLWPNDTGLSVASCKYTSSGRCFAR